MTKIEQTIEQMVFALRENHYYMIDAGLPNQSMLNQNNKAIQAGRALLEELKGQEPVAFLANGTRFKISYDSRQIGGQIHGIPPELGGRWVAFVAADDDCHLKLTTPQPKQDQCELVAWRFTGIAGLKRYISQKMYEAQTPATKRWYEPFKCVNCTTPQQRKPLTDELIEYGKTASEMMARDQTRFDAACEVLRYLKQQHAPHYYLHRMLTVIHGNAEAAHGIKE